MPAQSAISACKQLRALNLRPFSDLTIQNESSLLQQLVALLPELRVVLFNKAC